MASRYTQENADLLRHALRTIISARKAKAPAGRWPFAGPGFYLDEAKADLVQDDLNARAFSLDYKADGKLDAVVLREQKDGEVVYETFGTRENAFDHDAIERTIPGLQGAASLLGLPKALLDDEAERMSPAAFVCAARTVLAHMGRGDPGRRAYRDAVIAIDDHSQGLALEVTRRANNNPTTMVSAKDGEIIRHHGEYSYLAPHLKGLLDIALVRHVAPKMTEARRFCLAAIAEPPVTTREICAAWWREQPMQLRRSSEWADRHVRWLREADLAEITGATMDKRRVHRPTAAGRRLLDLIHGDLETDRRKRREHVVKCDGYSEMES